MIAAAGLTQVRSTRWILAALSLAVVALFIFSLSIGQIHIPISEIASIFLRKAGLIDPAGSISVQETVLLSIRLPRLVMTLFVGASLGICGAALQGLFRNPLVEPGLIGVSSGSALAVVVLIVFGSSISLSKDGLGMSVLMPAFAFGGGCLATVLVMRIGEKSGRANVAMLILSGVAVNALAGALMGLIIFYADENQLRMFTFWTLGDLGGTSWNQFFIGAPLLAVSAIGLYSYRHALNSLALGESEAFHMGVDVVKTRRNIVMLSALAVGTSVSIAGAIGFVGLVVPHLIRVAMQSDNSLVMPASLLGGGLLLMLADLVARTAVAPAELPIGVVTALIGAPFFIYLLIRAKARTEIAS
jgi:iron complex transport system permease protein